MKFLNIFLLSTLLMFNISIAQEDYSEETADTVEVYLIDNYIKSETDRTLILSWMTNVPVKSKVEILNIGEFAVSDTLADFHQAKIDLNNFNFTKEENYFRIISELEDGTKFLSDNYSFTIPLESTSKIETKQTSTSSSYYMYNFLMGISLWLLPSPGVAFENNSARFAIIKDLPIISIGSSSAYKTFPYVYFYGGYSHIVDGQLKNSFRVGGKYLYEINQLKHFVSLGFGGMTNFKGNYALYGDIGFSFLKILNTFELFSSYSYNYIPNTKNKFHLITLGLFTSSFSINLNY
ncbi:MAG: hypothetical protein N3F03_04350 [Ignavibacteria bacterium]|nr:hypothetical protein [Ignavibacteria bacterium]